MKVYGNITVHDSTGLIVINGVSPINKVKNIKLSVIRLKLKEHVYEEE